MKIVRSTLPLIALLFVTVMALCLPAAPAVAAAGTLALSQASGVPGTYVAVTGSGWSTAGTTVISSVRFDSNILAAAVPVSAGSFNTAFAVPPLPRGPHTITATSNIPESATISFTITPLTVASATTGKVGDQVNVSGSGFNASSAVSIYLDSLLIASGSTDINGSFGAVSVTVPETPAGSHTINASDAAGPATAAGLSISPKLTASGAGAPVGGQLTISGKGYAASSPLTVSVDSTPVPINLNTNSAGTFPPTDITVPTIAAGNHTLKVQDSLGNNATVALATTSSIKANPTSGPVGSAVNVAGSGYSPNAKITLTYNGQVVQTNPPSITSDANGNFSGTFMLPTTAAGTYSIGASDGANIANASFQASSAGGLASSQGHVGDSIVVNGAGFSSGASVTLKYDNLQIGSTKADSGGAISASVVIPASIAGDHKILASDGANSVTLVFKVMASATLAPLSGAVGSAVTLQGTGFDGGTSASLLFDGSQFAKATSTPSGNLSIAWTVPTTSSGIHKVSISDAHNSLDFTFTVTASAAVEPGQGTIGKEVVVSGNAFRSAGSISVTFDSAQITKAVADPNGSFSVSFKVPAAKGGNHIIAVSDGDTNRSFNFVIDSTPPPAPTLFSPPSAAKAPSLASFEWTPVTDLNGGITYTFQLASDANFSLRLVDQSGLPSTTFKLIEAQKLPSSPKGNPYHWRVKAVDAASNESAWSQPLTFEVGFEMPTFAWYLIAAAVAIIAVLVGLIIGRKTARR